MPTIKFESNFICQNANEALPGNKRHHQLGTFSRWTGRAHANVKAELKVSGFEVTRTRVRGYAGPIPDAPVLLGTEQLCKDYLNVYEKLDTKGYIFGEPLLTAGMGCAMIVGSSAAIGAVAATVATIPLVGPPAAVVFGAIGVYKKFTGTVGAIGVGVSTLLDHVAMTHRMKYAATLSAAVFSAASGVPIEAEMMDKIEASEAWLRSDDTDFSRALMLEFDQSMAREMSSRPHLYTTQQAGSARAA